MGWVAGINGIPAVGGLSEETIFKLQSDVIRKIADATPAVIVGRCADYILRKIPIVSAYLFMLLCATAYNESSIVIQVLPRKKPKSWP